MEELLVPCKLLGTWSSGMAPSASPTALQLSPDPFASRGNEFYYRGTVFSELVLRLELREVGSYGENVRF